MTTYQHSQTQPFFSPQLTTQPIMLGLSGLSVANYIKTSPLLMRFLRPVSNAYANSAGYRRLGLKYDDLLIEENETAQKVSESFG